MPQCQHLVDGFIFSILNGNVPSWPDTADVSFAGHFEQALYLQGLYPLIYHLCKEDPAWMTWPSEIRNKTQKTAVQHAAHELIVETKTRHLLTTLQAAGIPAIVLKGTAIAYTHYNDTSTRTRGDVDLFFLRSDLNRAFGILEAEGYAYAYRQGYLGQELGFVDTAPDLKNLPLDIHWRSSSYVLLAQVLTMDEIIDAAIDIPELAPLSCAMNPVHALLHACVHWTKHTASGDSIRILWLYDIYLLVRKLNGKEIQQFIDTARQKKVSRICQAALARVEENLGCANFNPLLQGLNRIRQHEPSARMLKPGASSFAIGDLLASEHVPGLLRNLQDILLPPGAYILRFYGKNNALWLPLLYAHRLSAGLVEYIRRRLGS